MMLYWMDVLLMMMSVCDHSLMSSCVLVHSLVGWSWRLHVSHGQFLMLKGPDGEDGKVNSFEHMEKFWQFLKRKGISSHRSAIVKAIAEKAATFFVGIYDENLYEDDDDEDEDE